MKVRPLPKIVIIKFMSRVTSYQSIVENNPTNLKLIEQLQTYSTVHSHCQFDIESILKVIIHRINRNSPKKTIFHDYIEHQKF